MFSTVSFANICDKIAGHWSGSWEGSQHTVYEATLDISQSDNNSFYGIYAMSNGSANKFSGICQPLSPDEAYLNLPNSAPLDNTCRGLLIQTNNKVAIHFHCFNPNDSGYFTRVGD